MKIGNLKRNKGEGERYPYQLNKWYFCLEILGRHPAISPDIFRPHIFFAIVKFLDFGNPEIIGGSETKKKGFIKRWSFPFGIRFEIIRYNPYANTRNRNH